jgi:hypothetical protein
MHLSIRTIFVFHCFEMFCLVLSIFLSCVVFVLSCFEYEAWSCIDDIRRYNDQIYAYQNLHTPTYTYTHPHTQQSRKQKQKIIYIIYDKPKDQKHHIKRQLCVSLSLSLCFSIPVLKKFHGLVHVVLDIDTRRSLHHGQAWQLNATRELRSS